MRAGKQKRLEYSTFIKVEWLNNKIQCHAEIISNNIISRTALDQIRPIF